MLSEEYAEDYFSLAEEDVMVETLKTRQPETPRTCPYCGGEVIITNYISEDILIMIDDPQLFDRWHAYGCRRGARGRVDDPDVDLRQAFLAFWLAAQQGQHRRRRNVFER